MLDSAGRVGEELRDGGAGIVDSEDGRKRLEREKANLLVLGYSPKRRFRKLICRGLIDQILDLVQNVDLYLIAKTSQRPGSLRRVRSS